MHRMHAPFGLYKLPDYRSGHPLGCQRCAGAYPPSQASLQAHSPFRGCDRMVTVAQTQQMLRAVTVAAAAQQPRCSGAPMRPAVALRPAQAALAARLAAAAAQRRGSSSSARRSLAPRAVAAAEKVEELTIEPVRVIEGHVKLPGSKSLSNRILLLAALAEGTTTVENILVRGALLGSGRTQAGPGIGRQTPGKCRGPPSSLPPPMWTRSTVILGVQFQGRLLLERAHRRRAPARPLQPVHSRGKRDVAMPLPPAPPFVLRTLRTSATWLAPSRRWASSWRRTGPTTA